jgi:hypothetical protein
MERDDGLATNRNIFLASSVINYPLTALEREQFLIPFYLLVLHFGTTQSMTLSPNYLTV